MSNIAMKDITIPSLNNTYTFAQVDNTLAVTGAAADAKKTGDEISDLKNDLASSLITDTASGAIASFPDGSANAMESVVVAIEPVQSGSGDPSPTNIRPISGWTQVQTNVTGVNVWDEEWELGTYSLTDGTPVASNYSVRGKNRISCKPNTEYYCNNQYFRLLFYDASDSFISYTTGNGAKTTPANCAYMRFYMGDAYGTTYNHDISINYPATNTSYIAHNTNSVTVTVQLGQTVYGCNIDLVSGVMTIDRRYLLGSDADQNIVTVNGNALWLMSFDAAQIASSETSAISNMLGSGTYNAMYAGTTGIVCQNPQGRLYASIDGVTDTSTLSAWITANPDFYVVYKLATPTTVQLTAQEVDSLLGDNNVFADAGNVTVTYKADTKLYINKVLNA